jgi:hypothetical protein
LASIRDHVNNDEPGGQYDNELPADICDDENTANAPQDEDEERKAKNAKRAKCRLNAEAYMR